MDSEGIKELDEVVIRFSGDSGDGMQLAGNIFSNISACKGNYISTFPDYPAEIRAPQGSLSGVSGFQVHIGTSPIYTPGDTCNVLVAMNPAALRTQYKYCTPQSVIIIDSDMFTFHELKKAMFDSNEPFKELHLSNEVLPVPITTMCKESLKDSGCDNKTILHTKNMFALGLVCWLFHRDLAIGEQMLRKKFERKPLIAEANIKVLHDGYHFGANTHASISSGYTIPCKTHHQEGRFMNINGNKATAYGLIAAAEKAQLPLYLGSYPITPATDILHELAKHKSLNIKTVQCEDEIAACASSIGAAFAGALAVTTTSGPGLCLKSEAINLAVITELPLVIIDVQRGGPCTGLPTKTEQTDLLQALYGRSGESPLPVLAAVSPTHCFDAAYWACKIAIEHMTPVILLSDAYIANGSSVWRLPEINQLPTIQPPYVQPEMQDSWTPYQRKEESLSRYWAVPGTPGFMHRIGGLEKDCKTGNISTEPENHQLMTRLRKERIEKIKDIIPEQKVEGDPDADLLIVGFGGTYGHLHGAMALMQKMGKKVALAHFRFIRPLPRNTESILRQYPKVVVAEQNTGQFASYLRMLFEDLHLYQYNIVKGHPFREHELVEAFTKILED